MQIVHQFLSLTNTAAAAAAADACCHYVADVIRRKSVARTMLASWSRLASCYRSVARCQQLEASPAVRPGHGGRPPGRRRRRTQRRAAEFTSGTNEM